MNDFIDDIEESLKQPSADLFHETAIQAFSDRFRHRQPLLHGLARAVVMVLVKAAVENGINPRDPEFPMLLICAHEGLVRQLVSGKTAVEVDVKLTAMKKLAVDIAQLLELDRVKEAAAKQT